MAKSFITLISMLVICDCYIVLTLGAGNETNRNFTTTTPLDKRSMKRLIELEKHENVGSSSSREIKKKGRSGESSSSARERLTGKTNVEFVLEPETSGMSKIPRKPWTDEEQRALISLAYTTGAWKVPAGRRTFDWRLIEKFWNKDWNDKPSKTLKTKLVKLMGQMRVAAQQFDGHNRVGIAWSDELSDQLLKLYFFTEDGDKAEHGERIYAGWKKMRLPIHEEMTPKYLLDRADAMLDSVKKFDISDPRERTSMVRNREQVGWKPEQNEYFRHLLLKHPCNESDRIKNIFNEALSRYRGLEWVGEKLWYEHLRQVYPELLEVHGTSVPVEGSSRDTTHSYYHSFMDDHNSTSLGLGTYSYYDGMAGTSSHPVPSHDHPDLELHLNTLNVDKRSPDTNLKLGHPSHRKGHN